MKCPKCDIELVKKFYKGMMEVDCCVNCRGMWLDLEELDILEDAAFDTDEYKGSLFHKKTVSEHLCPRCGTRLQEFQYRLYDLKLEYCSDNSHGFWLDAGEDERIMEIMHLRARQVERKLDVESEWQQILKRFRARSFFDKLFK